MTFEGDMSRAIIHINIADFAVAVERVVDPRLVNRPVIIAPKGSARAVVYDMSEEAYQSGVRKQMALKRALRLCRDARRGRFPRVCLRVSPRCRDRPSGCLPPSH